MKLDFYSLEKWIGSVYPSKDYLKTRLNSNEKLKIYLGIDPTSPKIHIGHSVPLRLLKKFQEAGHEVILLIGDFTAMIGDPSGRDKQRKLLTKEQISKNFAAYEKQAKKILDFNTNPPKIAFNSTWWGNFKLEDFFSLASKFTLSQLSERDFFQSRIKEGHPIAISEFLYPILQGYDSVALNVDIEIGATDQTFNMLVGRNLIKSENKREKMVITTPLLEGTDGRKMSKTFGNTIDISLEPTQMYGKIMSIKDSLVSKYFALTTDINNNEINTILKEKNPMEAKKRLAFTVVTDYHSRKEAENAEREFERVVQKGEPPIPKKVRIGLTETIPVVDFLRKINMVKSNSEAKRLINQGGVKINNKAVKTSEEFVGVKSGTIVQIGKLRAVKVII